MCQTNREYTEDEILQMKCEIEYGFNILFDSIDENDLPTFEI